MTNPQSPHVVVDTDVRRAELVAWHNRSAEHFELRAQDDRHGTARFKRELARNHRDSAAMLSAGLSTNPTITFTEAREAIRAAGGDAWDKIEDPTACIRELRGGGDS